MAADAAADLAFLAGNARRSISDLRRAVEAVPAIAGRRGAHFLAVVAATLDALENGIAQREQDFQTAVDAADRYSVVRAMRLLSHDVMSLHTRSPWIESTRGTNLDLGLIYFVDEVVAALMKQSMDVVLIPSPEYMYWTIHKPFEDALRNLGVAYPASVPPVIVAYPVQEPHSLFLHLLVAHELGHSAVIDHGLLAEVFGHDSRRGDTTNALNLAVQEHTSLENSPHPVAVGEIRAILLKWLTELVCDGLALALLGPSYLFTFTAFSKPFGGPEPSKTHPPFTLRTRLLVEWLDAWGWRPVLAAQVPVLFSWIEQAGREPQEPGDKTYFLRMEEAVLNLSSAIRKTLEVHVDQMRFEPTAYEATQEQLTALIKQRILPAQLLDGSATDRRVVILAGWLEAFAEDSDTSIALARLIGNREYQRFLTKALEMSTVLDRWNETT